MFTGKIAVATNDRTRITGHIGKCLAFMIFEIEEGKITGSELRENHFTNHRMLNQSRRHQGDAQGAHNHMHLIEGLKDCKYLISSGGGWRVVEDLKRHDISTLFTDTELITDAVNKFIKGELVNDSGLTCNHE